MLKHRALGVICQQPGPCVPQCPAACPWRHRDGNSLPSVTIPDHPWAHPPPASSLPLARAQDSAGLSKGTPEPTELHELVSSRQRGERKLILEIICSLSHCTAGPAHIFHWKSFYLRDDEGRLTKVFMHHLNPGFQRPQLIMVSN